MTFGFGNQHSIQLSYGRIPAILRVRRTSVQWRFAAPRAPGIMRRFARRRVPEIASRPPAARRSSDPILAEQEQPCKDRPHHVSPIKNWKQLVVVVALAFIVPIAVIILLSQYVTDVSVRAERATC